MIRKLIKRPVAVSMVLFAVIVLGAVSIKLIPVSLMPDVDIPQITVQVKMDGSSAREIDQYLQSLRRELMQIPSLTDIRSQSESGVGIIRLSFDYGTDIDFTFVDVNERIDRSMSYLPDGTERPKAIKSSATDIPAFFVNMTVRDSSRIMEMSRLAANVISKRIEQIPEVAMVDLSGLVFPELLIIPDNEKLTAIGDYSVNFGPGYRVQQYPAGQYLYPGRTVPLECKVPVGTHIQGRYRENKTQYQRPRISFQGTGTDHRAAWS